MEVFKKRLRELRGKHSQEEIAKGIGTTPQSLGRYENGERKPDIEVLKLIAKHFNVSADYLLGLSNTPSLDDKIKAVCEITGLSEESIMHLQSVQSFEDMWDIKACDLLLSNRLFNEIMRDMLKYIVASKSSEEYGIKEISEEFEVESNGIIKLKLSAAGTVDLYEYRIIENFKKLIREIAIKNPVGIDKIKTRHGWYKEIKGYAKFESIGEKEVSVNGEHNTQKE